jgi:uncharacterized Zn finger protein (UPF0148 family)
MPCVDCPYCGNPAKRNVRGGYYCEVCGAKEEPREDRKKRRRKGGA